MALPVRTLGEPPISGNVPRIKLRRLAVELACNICITKTKLGIAANLEKLGPLAGRHVWQGNKLVQNAPELPLKQKRTPQTHRGRLRADAEFPCPEQLLLCCRAFTGLQVNLAKQQARFNIVLILLQRVLQFYGRSSPVALLLMSLRTLHILDVRNTRATTTDHKKGRAQDQR